MESKISSYYIHTSFEQEPRDARSLTTRFISEADYERLQQLLFGRAGKEKEEAKGGTESKFEERTRAKLEEFLARCVVDHHPGSGGVEVFFLFPSVIYFSFLYVFVSF